MNDLISIIVPVYNVEKYIEKSISSVCMQTYSNLEIILINDGSTDNSGEICNKLAQQDTRIKVFHKKNGGVSSARNLALANATGDYIGFVDPDDYIDPTMFEVLYQQLKKEDADVSSCNIMNVYESGETPQCGNPNLYFVMDKSRFLKEYLIGEIVPGSLCNKLIKKEIVNQIEFKQKKVFEDAFYHLDLVRIANKFVVNTKPLYHYYHRGESLTTSSYTPEDMNSIVVYSQFKNVVEKEFPALLKEANFRLASAYFYVFDKMLHIEKYTEISEFETVKNYLKKHAISIAKNDIFRKGRRISAVALKFSVRLYRTLMLANERKTKQIH